MTDTDPAAAWWATLDPEARKVWFVIITGWTLEGTIAAAFAKAQGEPAEPKPSDPGEGDVG